MTVLTGDDKHKTDILVDAVVEVLPATPLARPGAAAPQTAGGTPSKRSLLQKAWLERSNVMPGIRSWAQTAEQCEAAFVQVGKFDSLGRADVSLGSKSGIALGPLWSIRIRVMSNSKNWLIVKKVIRDSHLHEWAVGWLVGWLVS